MDFRAHAQQRRNFGIHEKLLNYASHILKQDRERYKT